MPTNGRPALPPRGPFLRSPNYLIRRDLWLRTSVGTIARKLVAAPVQRAPKPLLQLDHRRVPEQRSRFRDVGLRIADVSGARGLKRRGEICREQTIHDAEQLVQ